jgi:type I site-specific restriction endonuclease
MKMIEMASPTTQQNMDTLFRRHCQEHSELLERQYQERLREAEIYVNEEVKRQVNEAHEAVSEYVDQVNAHMIREQEEAKKRNESLEAQVRDAVRALEQGTRQFKEKEDEIAMLKEEVRNRDVIIEDKNMAIRRWKRVVTSTDLERTEIKYRVRGPTCGDNGGWAAHGPCGNTRYLNSDGRCHHHA